MAQRQVNIRLAEEDVAVLEAAAFLRGAATPDVVRGLLLTEISRLREQSRVQQALRLRGQQAAESDGARHQIDSERKRRGSGDGAAA